MKFSYTLNGIGWADVHFEIEGKNYYFEPSYLTEPLVDLVEGLLHIIPGCIPEDERRQVSTFSWNYEPVGSEWRISLHDQNSLRIHVVEYENIDKKVGGPKLIFDIICDLKEFVGEVVKSLESILMKYGFVGYRQTWYTQQDFPISGYLRLNYYLQHGSKYPTEEVKEEGYIEFERSSLKDEVKTLLSFMNAFS